MARIPDFKTLDEAVEFWETHDSTDYLDDMEAVEIRVDLRQNLFHPTAAVLAHRPERCPRCKSDLDDIVIEYVDRSDGRLLVIRDVPALRCRANGHEYLLEEALDRIERLLELEKAHAVQPADTLEVPVFSFETDA